MSKSTLALIERLGRQTADAPTFLAPCARGGTVTALIDGLVQRLVPRPSDFEGWGIFSMQGRHAQLIQAAHRRLVDKTLKGAVTVRMILIRPLRGSAWLALPQHQQAFTTRFAATDPVLTRRTSRARRRCSMPIPVRRPPRSTPRRRRTGRMSFTRMATRPGRARPAH